jgi:hypothetical protein
MERGAQVVVNLARWLGISLAIHFGKGGVRQAHDQIAKWPLQIANCKLL